MPLPYVNIHTHFSPEENEISILNVLPGEKIPSQYFSMGMHPWYAYDIERALSEIKSAAENKNCIAIGECGLDKLSSIDFSTQQKVFRSQVKLAQQLNMPLIIHCVKSHNEVISILKEENFTPPVIFHGFNNNFSVAEKIITKGYFLSFGFALSKPDSNAAVVLKKIPPHQFFLETDDKRIKIDLIYMQAANILSMDEEELKSLLHLNFNKVFIQ